MNDERELQHIVDKLLGYTSCATCKFLYGQDTGYSNYTVTDTDIHCALERNPHLPTVMPFDWKFTYTSDNWPATQNSRCEKYDVRREKDEMPDWFRIPWLDVDGEKLCEELELDDEATKAIQKHSGRP